MPYCDNFWHKDAQENVPSPACLIFFVKSKTENQLIRVEAASDWNMVRHPAKNHWSAIDQWRVFLNACFKAKDKHFKHMLWCAVSQLSIICYETYISFFCFHLFTSNDFESFSSGCWAIFDVYWISYCINLISKGHIFTPFCYKFIQVTVCKKWTY